MRDHRLDSFQRLQHISKAIDDIFKKVKSIRNLISHEYFNIKMEAVRQIIQTDLPELKNVIQSILKNEFGQPSG